MVDSRNWVVLCKRTNDPKLSWLEKRLLEEGIVSSREGFSFHAPVLWVRKEDEAAANAVLDPVDDIPDDDPQFDIDVPLFWSAEDAAGAHEPDGFVIESIDGEFWNERAQVWVTDLEGATLFRSEDDLPVSVKYKGLEPESYDGDDWVEYSWDETVYAKAVLADDLAAVHWRGKKGG